MMQGRGGFTDRFLIWTDTSSGSEWVRALPAWTEDNPSLLFAAVLDFVSKKMKNKLTNYGRFDSISLKIESFFV